MRRSSLLSLVLASFVGSGCQPPAETGEVATPLIGGEVSTADPAVVALTRGGSASFCTGTLISPSVVLTAAHCIDMAGSDPNFTVFFGSDTTSEGIRIGTKGKQQHLGWTGDLAQNNDIGLLLLDLPQDPTIAVPLNTTPASDLVNQPYRPVGFGIYDQANQLADGKKRTGNSLIAQALSPPMGDEIIMNDSQTIVCFGDSGGPGFVTIDEVEYVAGVHSWTSGTNCGPPNGDTRVDLFVDSFILPWIQQNDTACGADGLCAKIGCIDDPDCAPCGPDGTCTADCPLPDPDCPTSALGEICQANTQCMSGLCVFWRGDTNTKFCSQPCADGPCPAGMSCQNVQPFGDVCYYDEAPPGVIGDDCEAATDCGSYVCQEGACTTVCDLSLGIRCPTEFECRQSDDQQYYCFGTATDDGGGCNSTPAGGPATGLAVLLGLALLRRRRAARSR